MYLVASVRPCICPFVCMSDLSWLNLTKSAQFIIDCVALARQGNNALGSICLSICMTVRPSVNTLTPEP